MPVLKYQASRGFAHVSESCMLKLMQAYEVEVPSVEAGFAHEETEDIESAYAIVLARHFDPSLDEAALSEAMERRCVDMSEIHGDDDHAVDDDLLDDVALKQDAMLLRKQREEVVELRAKVQATIQKASVAVQSSFKRKPAPKKKAIAHRRPGNKPREPASGKPERWWNDVPCPPSGGSSTDMGHRACPCSLMSATAATG